MAERKNGTKRNGTEIDRAVAEGMGSAIGGLEQRSAEFSLFLQEIIERFRADQSEKVASPQFTLREVARMIVKENPEMAHFADRIDDIKVYLKEYLGGETDAWHELEEEETKRRLNADQTLGGTPG